MRNTCVDPSQVNVKVRQIFQKLFAALLGVSHDATSVCDPVLLYYDAVHFVAFENAWESGAIFRTSVRDGDTSRTKGEFYPKYEMARPQTPPALPVSTITETLCCLRCCVILGGSSGTSVFVV